MNRIIQSRSTNHDLPIKSHNHKNITTPYIFSPQVKAARKGDMEFLKPGGGNLSKKKRAGLVLDCTDEVGTCNYFPYS